MQTSQQIRSVREHSCLVKQAAPKTIWLKEELQQVLTQGLPHAPGYSQLCYPRSMGGSADDGQSPGHRVPSSQHTGKLLLQQCWGLH